MATADYPLPTIICSTSGTGLQPRILDATPFFALGYPPVVQIHISATATVVVYGAVQLSGTNPATLVDPDDVSSGGFTTGGFYDLIVGIPFYAFNITANTGVVIIKAGIAPTGPGILATPSTVRMTTNATSGM